MSPAALPADAHAALRAPAADREGALALALLRGVGPRTWRQLWTRHPGAPDHAAAAHGVDDGAWAAARAAARDALAGADARTHQLLLPGDPAYPASLLDLPDPPVPLYARGAAALLAGAPRVAVVGTRQYTAVGERTTRRLVAALRGTGAVVVSGLARGIDTVAHAAALAEGLPTVAVLGTGVDVPYPAQNAQLYARIAADGCVAAEAPPGTRATPGAFPRRNRIVAALADLVVVVEAGVRSGALITAGIAADLGRAVAAVPGSVEAPSAAGTNLLLRDGAHVLADPSDVRSLLGVAGGAARAGSDVSRRGDEPDDLTDDERALWRALAVPATDPDALAERAGLSARRCGAALATLELRGHVRTDHLGETRRGA